MKDKFNLGIEISKDVFDSATPSKIKRYDAVPNKKVTKIRKAETGSVLYRYRPGASVFMTEDDDV